MTPKSTYPLLVVAAMLSVATAPLRAQPSEEDRRYKLAQGYEESGDWKNAARVYLELHEADPQSNIYFEGVRRTLMAMLQFKELLPIVAQRTESHPNDIDIRALHAQLLHRTGQRDQARIEWAKTLDLRPQDPMTYLVVGQSQTDVREFALAVATYKQGREAIGGTSTFADQLAELFGITGRFEDAAQEYLQLLAENPARLSMVMGGLSTITSTPEGVRGAITVAKRYADSRPDYVPYMELLSWLYTEAGDDDGAFEVAKQLDEARHANGSNIYSFADRAFRTSRYQTAIRALEYFLAQFNRSNPLYLSALYTYARALDARYHEVGAGDPKQAAELVGRYRTIVAETPNGPLVGEALLQIARLQSNDLGQPEAALATLKELLATRNTSAKAEGLLLEGELLMQTGKLKEAQDVFLQGRDAGSVGRDAERLRDLHALRYAESLFYSGQFQPAVEAFTQLTQNTKSDATNDALDYLLILQENFEKNDEALKLFAEGSYAVLQKHYPQAITAMDAVVAKAPQSTIADDALLIRSRSQESLGDSTGALQTLLQLVARYPDGALADRALFRAAQLTEQALRDPQKAAELYTRLLNDYPRSRWVVQARAKIRALRGGS
ncbi:MAG: tetratricopeptide repeat protein [Armatimonadetes bacterium]|nr:tetratricopeptide repeat protein [Armatimonadota bacterium]